MNGKIELRDGDAMEILADLWRKSGEVNGGDLVELVSGLLKETGRPVRFTEATPRNMRRFAEKNPAPAENVEPRRCFAVSIHTDEEVSADAGDYWNLPDDEPLTDDDGEPMILAVKSELHGLRDALNGAPVHVEGKP